MEKRPSIFAYLCHREGEDKQVSERRKGCITWLVNQMPGSEFKAADSLFFGLSDFCDRYGCNMNLNAALTFSETEMIDYIRKNNVRIDEQYVDFEDPITYANYVKTCERVLTGRLEQLTSLEAPVDEFVLSVKELFEKNSKEKLPEIVGPYIVSRDSIGLEQKLAELNYIYDLRKLEAIGYNQNKADSTSKLTVIPSGVTFLDKDLLGGLRSGQLLGIDSAPGMGKTRFAIGTFATEALLQGLKVLYIALEQGTNEIEAMFKARFLSSLGVPIDATTIEYSNETDLVSFLSDAAVLKANDIAQNKVVNAVQLMQTTYQSYFDNLVIKSSIDDNFYVSPDDIIKVINMTDKLSGPFDLIVVDYLALVEAGEKTRGKNVQDWEGIKKSYRKLKLYAKTKNKAVIAINQLTKEGSVKAKAGKDPDVGDVQGGMEAHRSCDFSYTIIMTEEMKLQGKMKLNNPKVRKSEGFVAGYMTTALGSCYFRDEKDVD